MRRRGEDLLRTSFTITKTADAKLDEIVFREGFANKSEAVSNIIEGYVFLSLDVKKEQEEVERQIEEEKLAFDTRVKELEAKKKSLSQIGKQKKVLDRVMYNHKEEWLQKLIDAFDRKSSFEGISAIAKEGQRVTGIDARELITESIRRKK